MVTDDGYWRNSFRDEAGMQARQQKIMLETTGTAGGDNWLGKERWEQNRMESESRKESK